VDTLSDASDDVCPDCGSRKFSLDYLRAELVCQGCGLVIADRVLKEPSAPAPGEGQSNDVRLRPQLIYSSRDVGGKLVSNEQLWTFRQTSQIYNLNSAERAAVVFEGKLRRLASQRGIPDGVTKRAVEIYYQVRKEQLFKKPNLNDLALALLMAASREMRYVITYEDLIGDPEENSIKPVYKPFLAIARMLGFPGHQWRFSVESFVGYYAGKIGQEFNGVMMDAVLGLAQRILDNLYELYQVKTPPKPHVMAAVVLYCYLKRSRPMSQRAYCAKVNLSEICLREWMKNMNGSPHNAGIDG
jgi:transcription initiation factor TFIIIB Brf1 subunit/transcription initiation factor TFIIB